MPTDDHSVVAVENVIRAVREDGERLIDLSGKLLGEAANKRARMQLFSFLKSCDNTRVLKLPKNELGGEECQLLSGVLRFSTSITTVDLSSNPLAGGASQLNFAGVEALFESVGKNTTLTSLDLSSTNLGGWNGKHGEERRINGAGASSLVKLKGNKSLKRLTLRSNNLSATGILSIAESISDTGIRDLNVADNEMLGFWGDNTDGLLSLASLFETNEPMTNLNMTSNSLHLMDQAAGEGLSKALATRLYPEPDEDMELGLFAEMMEVGLLCCGPGLKQLDLSGELIGAPGCLVIATLLKSAPGLEVLSLRGCAICSFFQDDMGCHTHGSYSTYGLEALFDAISTRQAPADEDGKEAERGEDDDEEGSEDDHNSPERNSLSSLVTLSLADNGLFGLDRHGEAGEFNGTVLEHLVDAVASSGLTSLDLSRNYGGTSALPMITRLVGSTTSSLQQLDVSHTAMHEHDSEHHHLQAQDALWMSKLMDAFAENSVLKTIRLIGITLNEIEDGNDNRERLCVMCREKKITLYLCDEPYEPDDSTEGGEAGEEAGGSQKRGQQNKKSSKPASKASEGAARKSKSGKQKKREFGDPKPRDVDLLVFEGHESDSDSDID
jgi:hypothetical protein